jgi:hypothetical protein
MSFATIPSSRRPQKSSASRFLHVVTVSVVHGRHAGFNVVANLRQDAPRPPTRTDHQAGGRTPQIVATESYT